MISRMGSRAEEIPGRISTAFNVGGPVAPEKLIWEEAIFIGENTPEYALVGDIFSQSIRVNIESLQHPSALDRHIESFEGCQKLSYDGLLFTR
jgi:hypothetical protein